MTPQIHRLADCMSSHIGEDTRIWQFCVIFPEARIGRNCNICANVLIENRVVVGNDVTVKSGVQLWDGVTLEDGVFIGPNVTFTNDRVPRASNHDFDLLPTIVGRGATVGANSTILCGVEIGAYAFIGAGSVVTKSVPPHTVWYGNPATQRGYVTRSGILLDMNRCDKEGVQHSLDE